MKTHKQFKMRFTESAYNEIINTIASRPAESGGLLIGREDDFIVRKFLFDKGAKTTRTTYSFDTNYLNPEVKRLWDEEGVILHRLYSQPSSRMRISKLAGYPIFQ